MLVFLSTVYEYESDMKRNLPMSYIYRCLLFENIHMVWHTSSLGSRHPGLGFKILGTKSQNLCGYVRSALELVKKMDT
jgi:hypothetical protein